jgi:hypothetical protein
MPRKTTRRFNGLLLQEPLSSEAKYWLGFLFADGCLSYQKNRPLIAISLGKVDSEHLANFANFCGVNSLKFDYSGHLGRSIGSQVHFSISNEQAERFNSYGIVPRKSMKEVPPPIFESDFDWWRGVIDGDGTILLKKDTPAIGLCGSIFTVTCFANLVEKITSHRPKVVSSRNSNLYVARECGLAPAKQLLGKIYYPGCSPALPRKMEVASRIISLVHVKPPINQGEKNASASLTNEQVRTIRTDSRPNGIIAREYNTSWEVIFNVKKRRSYASV